MRGRHPRDKHKGSDLDTNQKLLSDNDKRYYYTTTASGGTLELNTRNQTVVITNDHTLTVVLPPVAECGPDPTKRSHPTSFTISIASSTAAVTLTDYPNTSYNDSTSWGGDYTLAAEGDSIELQSTGSSWSVVSNDIA